MANPLQIKDITRNMTKRFLITIEYDGAPFVGWQRQDNGLSVQATLETAAAFVGGTAIVGAGRDPGVHATGQVAHLDVPKNLTLVELRTL